MGSIITCTICGSEIKGTSLTCPKGCTPWSKQQLFKEQEVKTCTWKRETSKYKAHDYWFHTCHTTVPKHVIHDFKFCPYCGGKIEWEEYT